MKRKRGLVVHYFGIDCGSVHARQASALVVGVKELEVDGVNEQV